MYRLTARQSGAARTRQQQDEADTSVRMVETTYQSLPGGAAETGEHDGHHEADNGEHSTLLFKGGSWQGVNGCYAKPANAMLPVPLTLTLNTLSSSRRG